MAPVMMNKVNFLTYPVDFNKTFRGRPILGPNKTFRGFFFGTLFSVIIINMQFLLYKTTGFDFTIYKFEDINFELLGFLMGFGVMLGDSIKSFIKRQLDIPPGKSFIPWDQIDCALGGLSLGSIAWHFPIEYGIATLLLTFILHIMVRYTIYYLGFSDSKW